MRKSYIATTSEASALHRGEQTAIIVKMGKQPPAYGCRIVDNQILYEDPQGNVHSRTGIPYALNEPVYVREAWGSFYPLDENENVITSAKITILKSHWSDDTEEWSWADMNKNIIDREDNPPIWKSPVTMPRSSARTRFKPVSCEVVRVQETTKYMLLALNCKGTLGYAPIWYEEYQRRMVAKLGQSAWDNNDYVFYYKIEKI